MPVTESELAIRHHALRFFAESGYSNTSLRQISTAAECDVALIAYYFGNKADLFMTVVRDACRPAREMLDEGMAQVRPRDESAVERSLEFGRRALTAWTEGERLLGLRSLITTAAAADSVTEEVASFARQELQSIVDQLVKADSLPARFRLPITAFLGLVVGTDILTHYAGLPTLAAMSREDLISAQIGALEEILRLSLSERDTNE